MAAAPSLLKLTEDAILSAIAEALPVPEVLAWAGPMPGGVASPEDWTADDFRRLLQFAPAVAVGFAGAAEENGVNEPVFDCVFNVYAMVKETTPEGLRGDFGGTIPLYAIIEKLLPALHARDFQNLCTVRVGSARPLFGPVWAELGGALMLIPLHTRLWFQFDAKSPLGYDAPPVPVGNPWDGAALTPATPVASDFLLAHSDWDIGPKVGPADVARWLGGDRTTAPRPDAQSQATLEGSDD